MNYFVDDIGHHVPVDIISTQVDQDGIAEITVRTKHLTIPRKVGKSIGQFICDDLIPAINLSATIKKVIFNDPATIVLWLDGTKTVVKCQEGDEYSKEKGLALCIAKKHLGNKSNFNNEFKRWIHD